ncbi:MAG: D-alanyl-D-alanine carboxypeptidase [Clostridiales bacterium]|nr:D-alanyl-D-alanine carboxypeptidase [Clostridiales bacterium]
MSIPSGFVWLFFFFVVSCFTAFPSGRAYGGIADDVRAVSFVLMDADTGQVLLERDMHAPLKPASITKIMTTMLALEKGPPDEPVMVSEAAVAANASDGSSAGLMPGEILPLEELLYAVMLESANEAANAAAEFVSGSMEAFAAYMTAQAKELGAENTQFVNANGLNDDLHYTSAYDMALITKAAIQNPRFLTIWGTYQSFIEPTNLQSVRRILNNKNRLLTRGSMPYDGILGGKTGFTSASLNTLVEAARRDGRTLVCVLMQGPSALANFQDAIHLLDYGFDAFLPYAYEDEEFEVSLPFLLHEELAFEEVAVDYGEPIENPDGSVSVQVELHVPPESANLMHTGIALTTLTSAPPPSPEEEPPSLYVVGLVSAFLDSLPGWLALLLRVLFSLFAALFVLACVFRIRRLIRRRRRLRRRRQAEARRRAYREQSYWS